ncbi:Uncharacterized [Syntrophomonas zehnderi OL-4]|uniref:Uncharacterized n=1 Tax=Syntrophomonas zehnderi OL-4 TaxID=690567 RepID=A0A0E4C7V3_9FIRM|nr:hypothetical protein [Syntrophomonas zehnderi]CFX12728.1 Uncharacterized [Syntrophomonas zehnderi OL-4]
MSENDLGQQMAQFFRVLATEIENNPALARKLAVPFQDVAEASRKAAPAKRKAKDEAHVPEGFDPFQIYYDLGKLGLQQALEPLDAATLKAILSKFALDPSRSYTRWRKPERLMDFIIERVKAMSNKGQAFKPGT